MSCSTSSDTMVAAAVTGAIAVIKLAVFVVGLVRKPAAAKAGAR